MEATTDLTTTEIGQNAGLIAGRLTLFKRYIDMRFPGSHPTYIAEWADRFAVGDEFAASDSEGQAMLMRMYQGSKQ